MSKTAAETIAIALLEEGNTILDLTDRELGDAISTYGLDVTVADLRATMYRIEAEHEQPER